MIDLNRYGLRSYNTYAIQEDSLLELISKVVQMVNEGEISINEMNKKIEYLLGEGLNAEVINKLELMIEDGTMETLINKTVFEGLNAKLDTTITNVENLRGEFTDLTDSIGDTLQLFKDAMENMILEFRDNLDKEISSFSKSLDYAPLLNEPNLKLFCTTNTKDFWGRKQPLTLCALVDNGSRVLSIKEAILPNRSYQWDADMIFHNGYYYIATDYKEGFEESFNDKDMGLIDIYKTNDFVNFKKATFRGTEKNSFAPGLFKTREGGLCMTYSSSSNTQTYKDKYGNDMYYTYVGFVDVSENLEFTNVRVLKNGIGSGIGGRTLDPQVYFINNNYYMYIKDEANKNTLILSATNIPTSSNDNNKFTLIKTIDIGQDVEGASLCKVGDKYHLYLDIYWNNKGYCYLIGTSPTDFYPDVCYLNEPFAPDNKTGHFGACDVEEPMAKDILNTFILKHNIDPYAKTSGIEVLCDKPRTIVDLEVIAKGNGEIQTRDNGFKDIQIYDMKLCGGCIYTLNGSKAINIQRVDNSNLRQGESIYFFLATGDTSSILSVESRGFLIPSTSNTEIKKLNLRVSDGYGDQLIRATKVGGTMLFENIINFDLRRNIE